MKKTMKMLVALALGAWAGLSANAADITLSVGETKSFDTKDIDKMCTDDTSVNLKDLRKKVWQIKSADTSIVTVDPNTQKKYDTEQSFPFTLTAGNSAGSTTLSVNAGSQGTSERTTLTVEVVDTPSTEEFEYSGINFITSGATTNFVGGDLLLTFAKDGSMTTDGDIEGASIFVVGGGGSGAAGKSSSNNTYSGNGGGGGKGKEESCSLAKGKYEIVVGAGGAGVKRSSGGGDWQSGKAGSASSFAGGGVSVSAEGGAAGSSGAKNADSGAGAGGWNQTSSVAADGVTYGANGGGIAKGTKQSAANGTSGTDGTGAGGQGAANGGTSGAGGSGIVIVRIPPQQHEPQPVDLPTAPTRTYNGQSQTCLDADTAKKFTLGGTYQSTAAGNYTATLTPADGYCWSDQSTGSKNLAWSIARKAATITANSTSKVVGKDDPVFTATVTGLVDSFNPTYTITREDGETIGTYTLYATGETEQGNYTFSYENGTFEIHEAKTEYTGDVEVKEIDDDTAYIFKSGNGTLTLAKDAVVNILVVGGAGGGGAAYYGGSSSKYNGNGGNGGDVYYEENRTIAAGEKLTIKVGKGGTGGAGAGRSSTAPGGSNGEASSLSYGSVSISSGPGTGGTGGTSSSNNKAGTAGKNAQTLNITGDDVAYGQAGSVAPSSGKASDSDSNTGNGGQGGRASSTQSNRDGGDGGSGIVVVRVLMQREEIPLPQAMTGLEFDNTEKTGVAEGEHYTISGNVATDAGTYAATVTPEDGYCWPDKSHGEKTISWTIAKRPVTVTVISTNKVVGTTFDGGYNDPIFTTTAEGLIASDTTTITWDIFRTNACEEVGTYDLLVEGNETPKNYAMTFVGGTYEILKEAPVPQTLDITVATGEGVADVMTNGVSVVGELKLPAGTTSVELDLVKDASLTIPVYKVVTNDVTNVTQRVATYAVVEGLKYTFIAEEAEENDPTVTPTQRKAAIIDAIDEENKDAVKPKIEAVVDTNEPPAEGKVSAKEMATWITDNGIKSADMAKSDYLVASVNLDTSAPITDDATVEFVEVSEDATAGFTFDFELKLSGEETPEELEVEAAKLAGYIQTTGDLGTGFENTVDPDRVQIDTLTGKVTITPAKDKDAEFFKIVIPKDPGTTAK